MYHCIAVTEICFKVYFHEELSELNLVKLSDQTCNMSSGFPLSVCSIYHHLECLATLLVYGAKPDLDSLRHLPLHPDTANYSVPHNIIRYR